MNEFKRRSVGVLLASVMLSAALSPQIGAVANLPDALVLHTGSVTSLEVAAPLRAELAQEEEIITGLERTSGMGVNLTAGEESGTAQLTFRLLGLVPVKTVEVTVEQPRVLIPGGRSLGVAVETEGVVVVGASDLGGSASPARMAGLRAGDVIHSVNGQPITSAVELSACIANGERAVLQVLRGDEWIECEIVPALDPRDNSYRLGVWVRDSTAGIGTLTFYDAQSGRFGALGHAITDVDTGVMFPIGDGAVYENEIVQITRGTEGKPGELTGAFFEEEILLGDVDRNSDFGIFGDGSEELAEGCLYPEGLPVGTRDEIHTGSAQILTTLEDGSVQAYDCEIEKLYHQSSPETRSMVVHITDQELLAQTGGIVQGMSGSPIVQNDKIVGAVTHVFVSDPTRGYGVYIEWMLDAAA